GRSRPGGGGEPHAVRRRPRAGRAVRHAPAAGEAHPGAGTGLPRRTARAAARALAGSAAGRSGRGPAAGLVEHGAERGGGMLPAAASEVTVTPPMVAAQIASPGADDYRRADAIAARIPE